MGTKCQYCECDHAETGPCPTQEAIDNYGDYEDQDDDGMDEMEEAEMNCGEMPDGGCSLPGTEYWK